MREESETVAYALFGFHLQSIVFVVGVVAVSRLRRSRRPLPGDWPARVAALSARLEDAGFMVAADLLSLQAEAGRLKATWRELQAEAARLAAARLPDLQAALEDTLPLPHPYKGRAGSGGGHS